MPTRRFISPLRLALMWLAVLLAATSVPASAHPMSQSAVAVSVDDHGWRLRLVLPDDRLAVAMVQVGMVPDPGPGFTAFPTLSPDLVRHYVTARIAVRDADGRVWHGVVTRIVPPSAGSGGVIKAAAPVDASRPLDSSVGPNDWRVDVDLVPPSSGPVPSSIRLDYDVITHDIITHVAVVTLERDWANGVLPNAPRLIGQLVGEDREITVARGRGSLWESWLSMLKLGIQHILTGPDHIAFLVTILLTVPLFAAGGTWRPLDDRRQIVRNALWRISAFTLGHSLSLLAASLRWLPAGGALIEQLIAVSVAVSAIHALRPIFPRREAWIAGVFGIVHGMAFATVIAELNLATGQVVVATLWFNLGIELVQLGIAAVLLPLFYGLRHQRAEWWVRNILAGVALCAAVYWFVDRL